MYIHIYILPSRIWIHHIWIFRSKRYTYIYKKSDYKPLLIILIKYFVSPFFPHQIINSTPRDWQMPIFSWFGDPSLGRERKGGKKEGKNSGNQIFLSVSPAVGNEVVRNADKLQPKRFTTWHSPFKCQSPSCVTPKQKELGTVTYTHKKYIEDMIAINNCNNEKWKKNLLSKSYG